MKSTQTRRRNPRLFVSRFDFCLRIEQCDHGHIRLLYKIRLLGGPEGLVGTTTLAGKKKGGEMRKEGDVHDFFRFLASERSSHGSFFPISTYPPASGLDLHTSLS